MESIEGNYFGLAQKDEKDEKDEKDIKIRIKFEFIRKNNLLLPKK
jgi:hypothetical protein